MICTGAKDGAMSRVEVMSGPERRRRWSEEQKRSIVAEAFAPGASVSEVARRRDVVSGQIYRWRRELGGSAVGFAEVVVSPPPVPPHAMSEAAAAAVEIEIGTDIRVRLPMTTPKELAGAVIKALAAR
jgi:transposase